jgi:hypothetical protein
MAVTEFEVGCEGEVVEMSEEVNMTWRQTLQRRRIHSADLQALELRYLGLFESIQNLRRESGVVVRLTIVCCC